MKIEREKALEHKKRMSRMMEDKENFLSKITAARSFIYEVRPFSPSINWSLVVITEARFLRSIFVFQGKTESFPGAFGGGEEEASGRQEAAAQRRQA